MRSVHDRLAAIEHRQELQTHLLIEQAAILGLVKDLLTRYTPALEKWAATRARWAATLGGGRRPVTGLGSGQPRPQTPEVHS